MSEEDKRAADAAIRLAGGMDAGGFELCHARLVSVGAARDVGVDGVFNEGAES
jgi:hypothetical protein